MNLALARARTKLYTSWPFERRDLFDLRQQVLAESGLSEETITAEVGVLTAMPVWFCGGRFDLEPIRGSEAETAIVCEVLDVDGVSVIDLVAWRPERPAEIATSIGQASMLGAASLDEPPSGILAPRPLRAHRSVADWLRSRAKGGSAIVPIDLRRTAGRLINYDGAVEADDDEHGLELQSALRALVDPDKIVIRLPEAA